MIDILINLRRRSKSYSH